MLCRVLCPATGGGALSAKSSSYLDDCCLSVSSYTAPSMNATSLLLFVDPDSSRSTPPGYVWPYDGSEGAAAAGSTSAGRQGLSSAGLAGLIVGVVAAAVLAALLIWLLAARQQRRRQYGQAAGGMYKLPLSFSVDMHQSSNNSGYSSTAQGMCGSTHPVQQYLPAQDGRLVADVAVVGAGALDDQQQSSQQGFSQSGSGSGTVGPMDSGGMGNTGGQSVGGTGGSTGDDVAVPGTKRWQKLTTAISSKVQDIHQQRLRTAFMQSQRAGSGSSVLAGAAAAGAVGTAAAKGLTHGGSSRNSQGGGLQPPPQEHLSGVGDGGSSGALQFSAADSGAPGGGSSSSGTLSHSGTAVAAVGGAALGGGEAQQGDGRNTLALKELIGRGTFGTVYR